MWLSALRRPDDGGRTEPVVSRRPAECLQVRTAERVVFNPKVEAAVVRMAGAAARAASPRRLVDEARIEPPSWAGRLETADPR